DAVYPSLPEGAQKPVVLPFDPASEPVVVVTIRPRDGNMALAKRLAEYEGRAALRRVEGAASVVVVGGMNRETAVAVRVDQAAARGMSVLDVASAIAADSIDLPAGSVREGTLELVVLARGRVSSAEELSELVVRGRTGAYRLSEIASVYERNASRDSLFVVDGKETLALELYVRPGMDPVRAARNAREAAAALARTCGDAVEVDVLRDTSVAVARSTRDLAIAGAAASLAAAFVLVVLLGDAGAGALVTASIPLSLAAGVTVLWACGRSINAMSLGGLGLAVGMISDSAVVVLGALGSRFSSVEDRPSPDDIAITVDTVLAGTSGSMITTMVVFLPVYFLPGALGALFADLALAIMAANAAGWFLAVLALPAVYRVLWKPGRHDAALSLEAAYRRVLAMALRNPVVVLVVALAMAAAGSALVLSRPASFMPPDLAQELIATIRFPPGTDADGMVDSTLRLTRVLCSLDGLGGAYGWAGSEPDDSMRRADPAYSDETLSIVCPLLGGADVADATAAIAAAARASLGGDVIVTVSPPEDPAATILGLDGRRILTVRARGHEKAVAESDQLVAVLLSRAGDLLSAITMAPQGTKPGIRMSTDREAAAALRVSVTDAARVVRAASEGVEAAVLEREGRQMDVLVFAAGAGLQSGGNSLGDLAAIPMILASGASVPVSAVTSFERTAEEATIARLDRANVVYVSPIPIPGMEKRFDAELEKLLSTHPSVERADGSVFSMYGTAMLSAVAFVLVLLYLVLGAQFESFTLPLAIMATIPLSMAGVGPALVAAGLGLDSGSIMGIVVLFGLVVNNALLLYESSIARIAMGASSAVASYAGAIDRVRSVLATTLTTVVALFPLCLMRSSAAQRSMSISLLGGLVASATLTLFVSPIMFVAILPAGTLQPRKTSV
ncbi:MAG: efflux RND transporter permease subunit, partial [Spirochaetales bacterium]|nr:efflux RND transporter permease subunit [Spirochaetales bacterium]